MTSNPIRDAKTPEACSEALETMLSAESDPRSRLALLFDAAVTCLDLEAFGLAEETTRGIAACEGDLLSEDESEPSLKEAAFTNLAQMFKQTGRERQAFAAFADAAKAALQANYNIPACQAKRPQEALTGPSWLTRIVVDDVTCRLQGGRPRP